MANIEKFCATGVFDPTTYSQGIKVTQAQTILFLSGQVAYTTDGGVARRGDFKGRRAGPSRRSKRSSNPRGGTMANIVKITTYVTDMRYRVDLVPLREEFLWQEGTCIDARGDLGACASGLDGRDRSDRGDLTAFAQAEACAIHPMGEAHALHPLAVARTL